MKIYGITYDFDNGFELTTDTVDEFYSDLQYFLTISGDVIELKDMDVIPNIELDSVDSIIFMTLDEKKVHRYYNYFKKAIANAIDVEIEQFNRLKEKIKSTQLYAANED